MSGARHRRKGNRVERELVAYLQDRGFAAERYRTSADRRACRNTPRSHVLVAATAALLAVIL